ncbi:MAG TPA: phenylalanine--tRNA ligase subunit alpha, partial [Candidatus Bilamarchaeaceae archaeon]|nr:phenylalanine--tRNA ligase subunit alpha [Candidatus Bilamarchaeaceae archaeon]
MYKGEKQVMEYLQDRAPRALSQIAAATKLHMDSIRRIVEDLKGRGLAEVETQSMERIMVTPEFTEAYTQQTLPEFIVFQYAQRGAAVKDIPADARALGLLWAKKKGYIQLEGGRLVPVKKTEEVEADRKRMLQSYEQLQKNIRIDPVQQEELYRRKFIRKQEQVEYRVRRTEKPYTAEPRFDISAPAADATMGKAHPLRLLQQKIQRIFLEMGFSEMEGSLMESAFWNFDALFQPQDHPARDLADTFYIEGEQALQGEALVKRVKEAHEKSWKYRWNEKEAQRQVLRTHTTALSARYLARLRDRDPRKFFAIGKVFRNEATDYKHLTEFYQVEGIVVWEKATFGDLLGILKEFYRKLGFEKIRFRPSYFPYTEPSLEVEIYFEPRQ